MCNFSEGEGEVEHLLNECQNMTTCLFILDGRFSQLHTLYVDLVNLDDPSEDVQNQVSFLSK